MNRTPASLLAPALVAAALFAAPAVAGARAVLQAGTKSWPVTDAHRVRMQFPIGELRIESNDDDRVRLELLVKCKGGNEERCAEHADDLRLVARDAGGVLTIEIEGYPKFNPRFSLHGVLQVPRRLALDVEMGVGELEVFGMEGPLDVDLGIGEATMELPRTAVRSVRLDVGIGDARLRADGARRQGKGFIGREVRWSEGEGASPVKLTVGIGDARVALK